MKLFFLILIFVSILIVRGTSYQTEPNELHTKPFFDQKAFLTKILDEVGNLTTGEMLICRKCKIVVNYVLSFRKSGANRDSMAALLSELCYISKGFLRSVCQILSDIETDVILYIIDNKHVKPEEFCGVYFQKEGCTNPYATKWVIDVPPKTSIGENVDLLHSKPLKIVQITDVHYDPSYKAGSNAKCDLPLCCEENSGLPIHPENAAGTFGDYRKCDMPRNSIVNLLKEIKISQNFSIKRVETKNICSVDYFKHIGDYRKCDMPRNSIVNLLKEIKISQKAVDHIYFTGDIVAHKDWETSRDSNLETIKEFYDYVFLYFGNASIYPILGNHEAYPCNLYAPLNIKSTKDSVNTRWLFDAVADYWSKWLPKNALETIKIGGYYTVLVQPGFRIVALNSNVCFTENLWLVYEDEDPYGQLKWLVEILVEAEKNNEKVHILSHIPPGEASCHRQWQYNFNRIVHRFSGTISAHFNGHTHVDELRIYKNESNPDQAVNVAYNGGSFTTFTGLNPDYRVYDIDPQNFMVLDIYQYTFNLSLANAGKQGKPEWYQLYSFKAAYGLDSMSYDNLMNLNKKLWSDAKLAEKYVQYYVRESEFVFENGCNKSCVQSQICHITAITADDSIKCGAYDIFS